MKKKRMGSLFSAMLCAVLFLSGCRGQGEQISLEQVLAERPRQGAEVMAGEQSLAGQAQTGAEEPGSIWVHICGAVQTPGLYELESGSRIYDGVMAAGGFAEDADHGALNLAQSAEDGMQILVPRLTQEGTQGQGAGQGVNPDAAQSGRININTASAKLLQELPGIGESRARDIIAYREKHGGFQTIEQIKEVSGIKDAVFEKIEQMITVGD